MSSTSVQIAEDVAVRTARQYLRVSKGRGRTARSIDQQNNENIATEREHGPWTWAAPYADTGSASKFARKIRDDFEKMLIDLRSGEFGAPGDVLVLWEISRLSRETGKGVALVDACEASGYLIHITSHERTYDPSNYQDRHSLISGINDSEKEARLLSARTRRGINSAAAEGRPHGKTPVGYARAYEIIDGRPRCVRQYPEDVWGPRILNLFERTAGSDEQLPQPIYAIAQDWERRGWWIPEKVEDGIVIPSRPYSPQHLRAILVRPCYAGLRLFKGELIPIQWEGYERVVPRALFERVQSLLSDPSRRTYMGGGVRWALSVTLRCDPCGGPMVVGERKKTRGYECKDHGCTWVTKSDVDAFLIGDLDAVAPLTGEPTPKLGVILGYIAEPHRLAALRRAAAGQTSQAEGAVRAELALMTAELKELEDAPRPTTARARIARTDDMQETETKLADLEAKLRTLTTPDPLTDLLPDPDANVAVWWAALTVRHQRAVAALMLTPDLLGQVRVTRAPGRVSIPVTERLRWQRVA